MANGTAGRHSPGPVRTRRVRSEVRMASNGAGRARVAVRRSPAGRPQCLGSSATQFWISWICVACVLRIIANIRPSGDASKFAWSSEPA